MKNVISTDKAPKAIGPYSQGISKCKLMFTSGQIPLNPETGTVPEGITAQTEQSLKNLEAVIIAGGRSLKDVLKTTVFLSNMENFSPMNEIYAKFFTEPFPARSCVEVARLPKDVLVEIEAIVTME